MSNDEKSGGQDLEFERQKLEIERQKLEIERMRSFLDVWETDLQPIHEMTLKVMDGSHAFAKISMQTLYLLNGGGLIAFPSFAKLMNVEVSTKVHSSLECILAFVGGLIFIAVANGLAYFTSIQAIASFFTVQEITKYQLHLMRDAEQKNGEWTKKKEEAQAKAYKNNKKGKLLLIGAIGFSILSLIAFITGTWKATVVLAGVPPAHETLSPGV